MQECVCPGGPAEGGESRRSETGEEAVRNRGHRPVCDVRVTGLLLISCPISLELADPFPTDPLLLIFSSVSMKFPLLPTDSDTEDKMCDWCSMVCSRTFPFHPYLLNCLRQ